jgi:hypothetical protein
MWYDALFAGSAAWFGVPAVLGTAFFLLRTVLGFAGVFSNVGDSIGTHDVPHDLPHDVPHDLPHDVGTEIGQTPLPHHADIPHAPRDASVKVGGGGHALVTAAEVFSVQTLAAFAGGFGWGGLIGRENFGTLGGLVTGVLTGTLVAAGVIAVFRQFRKLESDGSVPIHDLVGLEGVVTIGVPPRDKGAGQVRLEVRGMHRHSNAVSRDAAAPTGTKVLVVATRADNSVVVQPMLQAGGFAPASLTHSGGAAHAPPALERGES